MRYIKYLIIIICLFSINFNVSALEDLGVNGGYKGYVDKNESFTYTNPNSGYLGYSYKIGEDSNASAFCIDPGLNSPTISYEYYRELNLNTAIDKSFYKAYLYYVYNLTLDPGNKTNIQMYTDVLLRVILKDNGYQRYKDKATRDNQFFDTNGIADYIKNESLNFENIQWGSYSEDDNCYYWTKTTGEACKEKFENSKEYYQNFLNFNLYWENPITITPTIIHTEGTASEEGYYILNYKIEFSNGSYNFFDEYAAYNNGYNKEAYFKFYFGNINDLYDLPGNAINYTGESYITKNDNIKSFNAFVKISEEKYNDIKNEQGNVFVKLNYEYYHPLSPSNVYLNSPIDTMLSNTSYQRMVIFGNHIHSSSNVNTTTTNNTCVQNENYFFYNNSEVEIDEYISRCGCEKINPDNLSSSYNNIYNSRCVLQTGETYTSTLDSCDTESTMGKNTLTHNYTKSIDADNKYCSLSCEETVNIENYTDKYSVLAGKHFDFATYPSLNSSKRCVVNVKYNDWKSEFDNLFKAEVELINKYEYDYGVDNPYNTESSMCSCGDGASSSTIYYYGYYIYDVSGGVEYVNNKTYEVGACCNTKPSTEEPYVHYTRISNKIGEIEGHFNKLKACNKYLYNQTNFYDFSNDLHFYYQQTYSKYGKRFNYEKYNNVSDDSEFKIIPKTDEDYNDGYIEKDSENTYGNSTFTDDTYGYLYLSVGESSPSTTKLYGYVGAEVYYDYDIVRTKHYSSKYSPSVLKYVDSYTGVISNNENDLKNSVELGYVYDTDASAVPKTDNINYYEFKSLGDKGSISKYYSVLNPEKLKRYCTYEIKSDIFSKCEGANCYDNDIKSKIVYRIVDSKDVDPNERLGTDDGLKNWNNIKGKTVLKEIESSSVFNSENLEYSFTLDSAAIKEIRKYNNGCDDNMKNCDNPIKYSNVKESYSKLECNSDGNECTSKFITELEKNNGYFGNSIATNISGRDKWKYLEYNDETTSWSVGIYDKGSMTGELFEDLTEKLGGITP